MNQPLSWYDRLLPPDQILVRKFATAIGVPPSTSQLAIDTLFDLAFAKAFGSYLQAWHFLNKHALSKKTFEYGLEHAFTSTGRQAQIHLNSTAASYDILVAGEKLSCKTETNCSSWSSGAISKFAEARWIGNCNGDVRLIDAQLKQNFRTHAAHYSRIILLRAREVAAPESGTAEMVYRLNSIDISILVGAVNALVPSNYSTPNGARGSCSARLMHKGVDLGTIRVDASVEKITLGRLNLPFFSELFEWRIRL